MAFPAIAALLNVLTSSKTLAGITVAAGLFKGATLYSDDSTMRISEQKKRVRLLESQRTEARENLVNISLFSPRRVGRQTAGGQSPYTAFARPVASPFSNPFTESLKKG